MVNPQSPSIWATAKRALDMRGSFRGKWMQAICLPSGELLEIEVGAALSGPVGRHQMGIRHNVGVMLMDSNGARGCRSGLLVKSMRTKAASGSPTDTPITLAMVRCRDRVSIFRTRLDLPRAQWLRHTGP